MTQQTVQSCHTHIIQAFYPVSKILRSQRRFLSHGDITGPSCGDEDGSRHIRLRQISPDADPCLRMIGDGEGFRHLPRSIFGQTGDQDPVLPRLLHGAKDTDDLLRGLALSVDDLRHTLTDAAVHIHLRIADIREGLLFQFQEGFLRGQYPGTDLLQYGSCISTHIRSFSVKAVLKS